MNPSLPRQLAISDFTYSLPSEKIALHPLPDRSASRLLLYHDGGLQDHYFHQLPRLLPTGTTLLLNNTRVIEARLHFFKPSGGRIELFLLRPAGAAPETALSSPSPVRWQCLIGGASKWKPGQVLSRQTTDEKRKVVLEAHYIGKEQDAFEIEFSWTGGGPFSEVLRTFGLVPLPPYMKRTVEQEDSERYQTVFSKSAGSVAAPTASLHLSEEVMQGIRQSGSQVLELTLHVGAGTFQPVKSDTLEGHHMHTEPFRVHRSTLEALCGIRGPLVAVGTTVLRTLESLYHLGRRHLRGSSGYTLSQWEAYEAPEEAPPMEAAFRALLQSMDREGTDLLQGDTALLIAPGYRFSTATGLITNFHQPQSTLLCLVAAWAGDDWKRIYAHALEREYRFLSYGDGSLLWR